MISSFQPLLSSVYLLQRCDSLVRKSLSEIWNVNFNESSYTQAILPVSKGCIGISSVSQVALPAFLASATGAECALSCILPEDYVDASFEKAPNLWLTSANLTEAPSDLIQKHWTSPLNDATFDQLITDINTKNVKRLNAFQDPFGSAWLNVVPNKNIGLKLTDQQPHISSSLRLCEKICEKHTCRCGTLVEENGHHGLSCARSAVRFSRHHSLNTLMELLLLLTCAEFHKSSLHFGTIWSDPNRWKAPRWNYYSTLGEGKQLVCDVTCVDLLAPSRENGSLANPGPTAEDAEELKAAMYVCLTDKGYIF